jgi:hypothetical protein
MAVITDPLERAAYDIAEAKLFLGHNEKRVTACLMSAMENLVAYIQATRVRAPEEGET